MASGHAECHVTLVQDWGCVVTVACGIWWGRAIHNPCITLGGAVFYRMFGQETLLWIQSACSVTLEVDRK